MKRVNLWGCTTAEKLIALENAINQIGDAIPINMGVWDANTVYDIANMIQYEGSTYISIKDNNSNHTPDEANSQWWVVFAAQGEQGIQGKQGNPGQPGAAGARGRCIFAGSLSNNLITVYVENGDTPKNGDLIVITTTVGSNANLGNVYLVSQATGTTNIPVSNTSNVGNIRGPEGGSSGQLYAHYISFKLKTTDLLQYTYFSLTYFSHISTSMPFSQFVNSINGSFPNGTPIFCGIEWNDDTKGGYLITSTGSSSLRVTSGVGFNGPPNEVTINNTDIDEYVDNVI